MQVSLSPDTLAKLDASILHMIKVAEDIISVTEEENERLQAGGRIEIADLVVRKQALVKEYENWITTVRTQKHVLLQATPVLFEEMLERNRELSVALAENTRHLEKAKLTSHRRVETIMRVVREESQTQSAYSGNGKYDSRPAEPVSLRPVREA
ncbi:hypothetical protein [Roseibium algae]|uniref:FlgN protein n=1 Tax=Roseibium algae TaxID=3123038 RepID=A0ABU8TG15_9HYPH